MIEILELCVEGSTKARIVHQLNLSYGIASQYLEMLIRHDLIEMSDGKYKTTEKGKRSLSSLRDIKDLV